MSPNSLRPAAVYSLNFRLQAEGFLTRSEYRVYAALLLDEEPSKGWKTNRLHPSIRASLNRLKTGLRTNEKPLAIASDSPSTLQLFNPSTAVFRLKG